MKSQIISINNPDSNGFLISEVMIAFSLMTLFFISALVLSSTMQELRKSTYNDLDELKLSVKSMDYFISNGFASSTEHSLTPYGNDTQHMYIEPLTLLTSDYENTWGRDNCYARLSFNPDDAVLYTEGIDLGPGNISTDLEVRNSVVYMIADSAIANMPDVFIFDALDPVNLELFSSLNTGPGLSALEVAGHYIYAANLGTTNQLQVIDIQDRNNPVVVARLKLPLPYASSTAPLATSIFYSKGKIYLGTEKWEGSELAIIDVSIPESPVYIGGFETNTLVNDIYVMGNLAYLANSNEEQMVVVDISDPENIQKVASFSPQGWQTQEGKILSYFEGSFLLGRTVGGFNNTSNHELFIFSTSTHANAIFTKDIPGGLYGILHRPPFTFLTTRSPGYEFQVWNLESLNKVFEMPLGFLPKKFMCDRSTFYFATGNENGVAIITTE